MDDGMKMEVALWRRRAREEAKEQVADKRKGWSP